MKQTFSKFFTLNLQDLGKGAIVAVITTILASLTPIVTSGRFPSLLELKTIGLVGLTAGVAYLLKNLFTPVPSVIEIDPKQTDVINEKTKQVIA